MDNIIWCGDINTSVTGNDWINLSIYINNENDLIFYEKYMVNYPQQFNFVRIEQNNIIINNISKEENDLLKNTLSSLHLENYRDIKKEYLVKYILTIRDFIKNKEKQNNEQTIIIDKQDNEINNLKNKINKLREKSDGIKELKNQIDKQKIDSNNYKSLLIYEFKKIIEKNKREIIKLNQLINEKNNKITELENKITELEKNQNIINTDNNSSEEDILEYIRLNPLNYFKLENPNIKIKLEIIKQYDRILKTFDDELPNMIYSLENLNILRPELFNLAVEKDNIVQEL
jgi:hypothetical protein